MDGYCVNVSQCKPGDLLARDIYTDSSALLVPQDTKLTEYIIRKLLAAGITKVCIYEDTADESPAYRISYETFVKKYKEDVESIKEVINNLASGKRLDYEKVSDVADSMYESINEKGNIIRCLNSIKAFDEYTYSHSMNVALYSMLIGTWLKLPESSICELAKTGLLHDIGKSKIPLEILNKKGSLTVDEYEIMKKHTVYGYNIVKQVPGISDEMLKGILMHHEREDGLGYPLGAADSQIGVYAKIIAVADVYDALTSERVYKKRKTPFETFKIIERTGLGHFDTKVLVTFLQYVSSYYTGSKVVMNTGENGEVVYVAPHNISMPVVYVGGRYIDMSNERSLEIVDFAG